MKITVPMPTEKKDACTFEVYLHSICSEVINKENEWELIFKPGWEKMERPQETLIYDPNGNLRLVVKFEVSKPKQVSFLTRYYVVLDPKNNQDVKKCNEWRCVVVDRKTRNHLYYGVFSKFNSRTEKPNDFKNNVLYSGYSFLNQRFPNWDNPLKYWED